MLKKILIITCALMLIFVAGCQNTGGGGETPPGEDIFIGGNSGITAEFTQSGMMDGGIETIWINNNFPIEVIFKNKGEHTVSAGELTAKIQGIDTHIFGITTTLLTTTEDIEKMSGVNSRGGEQVLAFSEGKLSETKAGFYDANIIVRYDYNYKTQAAVPSVCFKEDYRETKLCELEGIKSVYSSGAPIEVTKVTQAVSGSKRIEVLFEIENKGNGVVTLPDGEFDPYQQKLEFELVEGDNTDVQFECSSYSNKEYARMNEGSTAVRCRSTVLPEDALYTRQLTLELSYRYRDDISKNIRIKNTPE